jgi:hypothetical protein
MLKIYITRLAKVADDDLVAFLKLTGWAQNSTVLNPLIFKVWKKLQQLKYKKKPAGNN